MAKNGAKSSPKVTTKEHKQKNKSFAMMTSESGGGLTMNNEGSPVEVKNGQTSTNLHPPVDPAFAKDGGAVEDINKAGSGLRRR